jgi:fumarylacetoacetase
MTDWPEIPAGSDFGPTNLPYGIFTAPGHGRPTPRVGVAIGEHVLDLSTLRGEPEFAAATLNRFLAQGPARWSAVRDDLLELAHGPRHRDQVRPHLIPRAQVALRLPVEIGDYVDFYSSRHHAENVGRMFRPDADPLTPNWLHLPIGYHGRSGTIVVSGTDVRRPCGQRRGAAGPEFGPSIRLDVEAEVGFVVGVPSEPGEPVDVDSFREHVFGVVLLNDWSARDIQAWEYQPLGPFLGKSFATSISPWVVPLAALEAATVPAQAQDPTPLPYLREKRSSALDLNLEVSWNETVVARPPFAAMYWTPGQQLAHLTVNGASLRTGDLYASGTVSGPRPDQRGSFLELTWNGTEPVTLADGSTRTFLADGDTVCIRASAPAVGGGRLGFGAVCGRIVPAPKL